LFYIRQPIAIHRCRWVLWVPLVRALVAYNHRQGLFAGGAVGEGGREGAELFERLPGHNYTIMYTIVL